MSTTNNDTSDIKKAAEQANGQEVEKNLEDNKKVDAPEPLSEEALSLLKELQPGIVIHK